METSLLSVTSGLRRDSFRERQQVMQWNNCARKGSPQSEVLQTDVYTYLAICESSKILSLRGLQSV
jgi:hypothetical protein